MIHLTIDDQSILVSSGYTLLQAARENNIAIPTLCSHAALLPYGACRLCLVELTTRAGKLVAACTYPCEDGLVVSTKSERVISARRTIIELLMATSSHLSIVRALAAELNVAASQMAVAKDDCILCGLCVRACRELVGVGAISLMNRGMEKQVGTPFQISSADCIECGTCALVCPTGAIHIEAVTRPFRSSHTWPSKYERRACRLCDYNPPGPAFPEDYQDLFG